METDRIGILYYATRLKVYYESHKYYILKRSVSQVISYLFINVYGIVFLVAPQVFEDSQTRMSKNVTLSRVRRYLFVDHDDTPYLCDSLARGEDKWTRHSRRYFELVIYSIHTVIETSPSLGVLGQVSAGSSASRRGRRGHTPRAAHNQHGN